ncbi:hypothetical protein DMN91_004639 [Ooceraea biroi]|uniref:Uncharacterized protein n=1 Tax=Ooceraea biroi TaxID=2015173 RepID=A0A3L8DPS4_OOCBI|nr:hypothetical protein DMN91_004639 [Ooceraea biroi]
MNSEKEMNELYAIVRFDDGTSNSQKLIDLIPSSWIYEVEGKGYFCSYPDSTDYCYLDNWLSTLESAETCWDSYAITIIAYAKDLKQGKRRLRRALKTDNIKISDDNTCSNNNDKSVMILSKDLLEEHLNVIQPLFLNNDPSSISLSNSNSSQISTLKGKRKNI